MSHITIDLTGFDPSEPDTDRADDLPWPSRLDLHGDGVYARFAPHGDRGYYTSPDGEVRRLPSQGNALYFPALAELLGEFQVSESWLVSWLASEGQSAAADAVADALWQDAR